MSWSETEFDELYEVPSKNGLTRPARVRGSGYKMINMGELFANDRIGDIDMELVPMNDKELSTMLVEPGDLLFARQSLILAGAGKCSLVKKADDPTTFESHIIRVRLKREIADPAFFHYYFKSPICRIRSIVTQGVQAGIRGNDLKKLKVHVPPVSEQTCIASILSTYDDLIENNRRRIQLLEESARLLYREWFVRLRFPGHEHVKIIDGVPEGWKKRHLSELVNTQYGFTETANPDPVGPKFLRGTDINKTTYIDWSTVPYCPDNNLDFTKYALKPGDIVVIRMADPGKVAIIEKEIKAIFASYLVRLSLKDGIEIPPLYLFYVLSDDLYQGFIHGASGGSTRKSASAKLLINFNLIVPSQSLVSLFVEKRPGGNPRSEIRQGSRPHTISGRGPRKAEPRSSHAGLSGGDPTDHGVFSYTLNAPD
jgi:type I restriction enzyme S subunit